MIKSMVLVSLRLGVLLAIIAVSSLALLPHSSLPAMAQETAGDVELAYDDGIPFKTLGHAEISCTACLAYQGVRFDLGGVEQASITSVRFYAGGKSGVMQVVITDERREHYLTDPDQPIKVSVSRAQWYTVQIPNISVSGDFWVWIKVPNTRDKDLMPFVDFRDDAQRSYRADNPFDIPAPVTSGDLLIRANVRAEIHVGKEQQYKYHTIQEAVDDAGPLLTLVVHPGLYVENVVVPKALRIRSSDGPEVTKVQSAGTGDHVFNITADGVSIRGFDIKGAGVGDGAGVFIADTVDDCLLADNAIADNRYGVYVSEDSRYNVVLQNSMKGNAHGIWMAGQQNNICGNQMQGNTAPSGAGIYLSGTSSDNLLRFNSFFGLTTGAAQVFCESFLGADAKHNWWGDASGPSHPSENPSGTGAPVGDNIEFAPWLGAAPVLVATGTSSGTGYVLDARAQASTIVAQAGSGKPTLWVASYANNPGGEFPNPPAAKWLDVCLSNVSGVDRLEIEVNYATSELGELKEGNLGLYWWNGSEWLPCSDQTLDTKASQIRATVGQATSPALNDLAGTPFAMAAVAGGESFPWLWVIVAIAVIVGFLLIIVMGRFVLGAASRRGADYDYE